MSYGQDGFWHLLTIRRIATITSNPVSVIRHLLDEHPEIQPCATADELYVYDRAALLQLLPLIDQHDASRARLTKTSKGAR